MATVTATRSPKGNIRLKRLIQFHGSSSLAITLPADFVHRLGLTAGQFVKCELSENGNSMTVEGIET